MNDMDTGFTWPGWRTFAPVGGDDFAHRARFG